MAQRDPLGMMLGHKGDTSVEKFIRDRIQVCVVSMEKSPAVLQTPFFKFLDSMKVSKSVLQDPCVPTILQDARSINTVTQIEWKFVFSQQHYKELCATQGWISAAIAISHLRGIHQCCSRARDPIVLMIEDDVEFTPDAETGFIGTAIALQKLEEQETKDVDVVWCTHSTHALSHLKRVVSAWPYWKHMSTESFFSSGKWPNSIIKKN